MYVGDAPTAHNHDASAITTGTLGVARGGTGLAALGTSLQVLRTNAGATALEYATITAGDALTTNPLSQFAATTSAQLAGVISDETGSGALVFATSPTLVTPNIGAATATSLSASGTVTVGNGINLSGASGAATTISTTTSGATLFLSTSGNGLVRALCPGSSEYQFQLGAFADDSLQMGRSTSTGDIVFNLATTGAGTNSYILRSKGVTLVSFAAGQIIGNAGNMVITAGTGNSRTMALRTTTAGGTATTALTLDASQNATFAGSVAIGGGTAITKVLSATATLDFPSISSSDTHTLTMTVTGAVAGDSVFIGVPAALDANLIWSGSVTAADTVTIRMHNASGASVDPASGTYRVTVFQF